MRAFKMLPNFCAVQYLLFISIVYSPVLAADTTLKFISAVFRHGDRTPMPLELYPNDPYVTYNTVKNVFEPPGYGQLTKSGELRELNLGKFLRKTYGDFLGTDYIPGTVESRSTDVNRTKNSLKLVLKGLYPEATIPTTFDSAIKNILLMPQICPSYALYYLAAREKPDIKKNLAKLEGFMKKLSKRTGKNINSGLDMYLLYTALEAERYMNLTLPPWTKDFFPDGDLLTGSLIELDIMNYDEHMKKRNGGWLVKKFLEDMDSVKNGKMDKNRKLMLYSSHDLNVVAVLKALDVYFPHVPKYSSAVIVELHLINEVYHVKVNYYKGIPAEAIPLTIPGCPELCPLVKFYELIETVIPTRSNSLCGAIRGFAAGLISHATGVIKTFKQILSE